MAKPGMTPAEIDLLVEGYLDAGGGYLIDFSYSQHESFYTRYCDHPGIDVRGERNQHGTTRNTFRAILEKAAPRLQAKIIRGSIVKVPPDRVYDETERRTELSRRLLLVADRLDGHVVADAPVQTTDTVQRALTDAERLLRTSGPVSAVDRVHTALHGHLKHLCERSGILLEKSDPTATNYLTALVKEHPKLQVAGSQRDEIKSMLRSLATIITSIGNIRNNASLAHANDALLDEAEALLVINAARTVFHYLDKKLAT